MKLLTISKKWLIDPGLRLDAEYYLSEGLLSKKRLEYSPFTVKTLESVTHRIFSGNIFKRTFVDKPEFGYPYITASDMNNADVIADKYISKRYTNQKENLEIKDGWILVSCSGTLGNTVFTTKDFLGMVGTHDLIRVIPDENKIKPGFLFAYLNSKFGNSLLTQSSYGGVVKHIEPHHIQKLPVPIFTDTKQAETHELILKASWYREQANSLLKNAINLFESKIPPIDVKGVYNMKVSLIKDNNTRMDARSSVPAINSFYNQIAEEYRCELLQDLAETIFTPAIFKRIRVDNPKQGIPFLSGSDLLQARPPFNSYLSKSMKDIDKYILEKGWIAIQDAGTIGYVSIINSYLHGVSATNNLVRIKPLKDINYNPYIFIFLKTAQGQTILKSLQYGSVQKHIDFYQIRELKLPIIDEIMAEITENGIQYLEKMSLACNFESHAIKLIENEIESWQN
ncbi:methylation-associated defense system restriction endonuclease subunit S MAD5 [Mucilaginibacter lappiensis]|uniref:methylation-associated defense system restriction endonuclease subunit S MAD5 n=1 Tax=Mucilaginibacter lappiensis TaxID=354630 RepID=UPI003D205FB2